MSKCCTFNATFEESNNLNATFQESGPMSASFGAVTFVHTDNYEDLFNKPIVNGHTVIGDKVGSDYDLQDKMNAITPQDIDNLFYGR